MQELKTCRTCKREKSIDDFWKNNIYKDGRYTECKVCSYDKHKENLKKRLAIDPQYSAKRQKAWAQRGRNDVRRRIKNLYGITLEEYDKMFLEQGNKCDLCGLDFVEGKRVAIDHDHNTGKIRGIIHLGCNSAIGLLLDSPDICRKAAVYLEKHGKI
jgi:hypothetical protein